MTAPMENEEPADLGDLNLLGYLADRFERQDNEVSVTVLVDGQWITGLLTSQRRYYDALGEHIRTHSTTAAGQEFADSMTYMAGVFTEIPVVQRRIGPEIFLREATVWLGPDRVPITAVAIRRSAIGAYFIGSPEIT